ncbi:hypothetical protein HDU93_001476, partial [Gonapodya sp. JEL0774]
MDKHTDPAPTSQREGPHRAGKEENDDDISCLNLVSCCDQEEEKARKSSEWPDVDRPYEAAPRSLVDWNTMQKRHRQAADYACDKRAVAWLDPEKATDLQQSLKFLAREVEAHAQSWQRKGHLHSQPSLRRLLLILVAVSTLLTVSVVLLASHATRSTSCPETGPAGTSAPTWRKTSSPTQVELYINNFGFGGISALKKDAPRAPVRRAVAKMDLSDGKLSFLHSGVVEPPASDLEENRNIDVLFTWVNGSDPLHQSYRKHYYEKLTPEQRYYKDFVGGASGAIKPPSADAIAQQLSHKNSFRDSISGAHNKQYDEVGNTLQAAVRSVVQNLAREPGDYTDGTAVEYRVPVGKIVLVTADFPDRYPGWYLSKGSGSAHGQIPSFLDERKLGTRSSTSPSLHLLHHSALFRDQATLPTFSSYAIELQFANLTADQISRRFIYLNDDMLFTRPHDTTDFFTSDGGLILNVQDNLLVQPWSDLSRAQRSQANLQTGEWLALHYSSELLKQRFGPRNRQYTAHAWRAFDRTILNDIVDPSKEPWLAARFAEAGTRRFRNLGPLLSDRHDIHMSFFFTHYVIARHRELFLLFISQYLDADGDGWWSGEERRELMQWVRGAREGRGERHGQGETETEKGSRSGLTGYRWRSGQGVMDGVGDGTGAARKTGIEALLDGSSDDLAGLSCGATTLSQCMPSGWFHRHRNVSVSQSRTFIVDRPQCGDCLVAVVAGAARARGGVEKWAAEMAAQALLQAQATHHLAGVGVDGDGDGALPHQAPDLGVMARMARAAGLRALATELGRYKYTMSGGYPWEFVNGGGVPRVLVYSSISLTLNPNPVPVPVPFPPVPAWSLPASTTPRAPHLPHPHPHPHHSPSAGIVTTMKQPGPAFVCVNDDLRS